VADSGFFLEFFSGFEDRDAPPCPAFYVIDFIPYIKFRIPEDSYCGGGVVGGGT